MATPTTQLMPNLANMRDMHTPPGVTACGNRTRAVLSFALAALIGCGTLACGVAPQMARADASSAAYATATAGEFAVGGSGSSSSVVPAASISLNKDFFTLEAGQIRTLKPEGYVAPDSGIPATTIAWALSDETVALVDDEGRVHGIGMGGALITASLVTADGSVVASCDCYVTVTNNLTVIHDASEVDKLQSPHSYFDDTRDVWAFEHPDAVAVTLTFDERSSVEEEFDLIEVSDAAGKVVATYTGTQMAGQTLRVEGTAAKIRLVADGSNIDWGFALSALNVEYAPGSPAAQSGTTQTTASAPTPAPAPTPDPASSGGAPMDSYAFSMPDVYGWDVYGAQEYLESLGMTVQVDWQADEWVGYGIVYYQSTMAGTLVNPGDYVRIVASTGQPQTWLPDVQGMNYEDAILTLYDAGYTNVRCVFTPPENPYDAGIVWYMDPGAYSPAYTDMLIELYVYDTVNG